MTGTAQRAADLDRAEASPADVGEKLRAVMRCVPSPVTVVTAGRAEPRGVTIGSFTSVSLDPPLISFNLMQTSALLPLLRVGAPFNVHVLREDQAALGYHFAIPGLPSEGQFLAVPYTPDAHGTPVLGERLSVLFCRVAQLFEAGDHVLVLGAVEATDGPGEGAPLLYLDRAFHTVGREIEVTPTDLASGEEA